NAADKGLRLLLRELAQLVPDVQLLRVAFHRAIEIALERHIGLERLGHHRTGCSPPTMATRSTLVAPGVPKGTPAVMAIFSRGSAKPVFSAVSQAIATISSKLRQSAAVAA